MKIRMKFCSLNFYAAYLYKVGFFFLYSILPEVKKLAPVSGDTGNRSVIVISCVVIFPVKYPITLISNDSGSYIISYRTGSVVSQ